MIILETNDERLKKFCDLWNAIPMETSFPTIYEYNNYPVTQVVIHIYVPMLNIENLSLEPKFIQTERGKTLQINFFLPKRLNENHNTDYILHVLKSIITDSIDVYTNISPYNRFRLEAAIEARNNQFYQLVEETDLHETLLLLNNTKRLKLLLMEINLNYSPPKLPHENEATEISVEENTSHLSSKIRMTRYLHIAPVNNFTYLRIINLPFLLPRHSETIINQHFSIFLKEIIDTNSLFLDFVKHSGASAEKRIFYENYKQFNYDQFDSLIKRTHMTFTGKRDAKKIYYSDMLIIAVHDILIKHLSKEDYYNFQRGYHFTLNRHEKIHLLIYRQLNRLIQQRVNFTFQNGIKEGYSEVFDVNFEIDPDTISKNIAANTVTQNEYLEKYKLFIRYIENDFAKEDYNNLIKEIKKLTFFVKENAYTNTVFTYLALQQLKLKLKLVGSIIIKLNYIYSNFEEISEIIVPTLISDKDALKLSTRNQKTLDRMNNVVETIKDELIWPIHKEVDSIIKTIFQTFHIKHNDEKESSEGRVIEEIQSPDNITSQLISDDGNETYEDIMDSYYEDIESYFDEVYNHFSESVFFQSTAIDDMYDLNYIIVGYYFGFHLNQAVISIYKEYKKPSSIPASTLIRGSSPIDFQFDFATRRPIITTFTSSQYNYFFQKITNILGDLP